MIEHQLELPLNKTRDATPEEARQWQEEELGPQAEWALYHVVAASIIQVVVFGFMLSMFWVIDKLIG